MAGVEVGSPRMRVEAKCARRGRTAVVQGCADILEGSTVDEDLVVVLGGTGAEYVLSRREGGPDGQWTRVWAARGLLHAWDDCAAAALVRAVGDPALRVPEMALKEVARHGVGGALDVVVAATDDPVPRVRTAATRAVEALTAAGA